MTTHTLPPEVKPCPFCGYNLPADEGLCFVDVDEFGDKIDTKTFTAVCCAGCGASSGWGETEAEAIAAWNRRAEPSGARAAAPEVKVRELEWEADHVGGGLRAGEYRMRPGLWTHGWYWLRGEDEPHTGYPDEEGAKAAAQADYTARILSALEPSGESVGAEPVAWLALAGENKSRCLCWTEGVALSEADGDRSRIQPLYAQPLSGMEGAARYRHKKRGSEYVLVGFGKMQAERWFEPSADVGPGPCQHYDPIDMSEVAIYRSVDDGSLWVRPREEFEDGRFEALSTPVSAASPEGEAKALAWFAKNICLELSWGPVSDDEGDECQWCVHERRGNVNDQEWELVGHGDTPIAAINDARHAASPATQEKNRG